MNGFSVYIVYTLYPETTHTCVLCGMPVRNSTWYRKFIKSSFIRNNGN